jgi:cytochrome P450
MVTNYDAASTVLREADVFAHKYEMGSDDGLDYIGVAGIPRHKDVPRMGLQEDDGPIHRELRRVLNPLFSPPRVEEERSSMRAVARWFLDQVIETGEMDIVLDYANPVPAVITLKRMGIPVDNWQMWAHTIHGLLAFPEGTPEQETAAANVGILQDQMVDAALRGRKEGGLDVTSVVGSFRYEGELLTDDQLRSVMWTLTIGGLNTTTGLVSKTLHLLSTLPELRATLASEPGLMRTAVEESLRHFSITQMSTRTVAKDVTLGREHLLRGDALLVNILSANHDESVFECPFEFRLDRTESRHLAFGLGPHRCIGSSVGRVMAQEMLSEFLERIAEYEIDGGQVVSFDGWPNLTGMLSLPTTFPSGSSSKAIGPF